MSTPQSPEAASPLLAQHPIYFAGGFGYGQERNQGVVAHLETLGYSTVPTLPNIDPAEIDSGFTVSSGGEALPISRKRAVARLGRVADEVVVANVQQYRADQLIAQLEEVNQPVDAVLQSSDALNGVLAAAERPELFHNLVLAYPGGLIRQPKPLQAAKGIWTAIRAGKRQGAVAPIDEDQKFESFDRREAKESALSDRAGSAATAASVTLSYQGSLLSDMRRHDKAPGVSLVLGARDWMIRPELVLDSLRSSTDVDYILVTDTAHGVNGRKDVMNAMLELFPRMEELKTARQNGADLKPLVDRILFLGDIPQERRVHLLELAAAVDTRSAAR